MRHDTGLGQTAFAHSPDPARRRAARAPALSRHPRRRHALAWAAAALLASPAAQALDVFTANAPVYVGSWFNGTTTETHEFQFAADWAGWCNAHANSSCQSIAFWNVAGNWNNNTIPNQASGDARVEIGQTVRVGAFNSLYRGPIGGNAIVNTLSAAGRVEVSDYLRVVNASFADLYLYPVFGRLDTTGRSVVSHLSSGLGKFGGAGGTTQLGGWSASAQGGLEVLVLEDHTLNLAGVAAAPMPLDIRLVPTARLLNQGALDLGGGQVWLQGSANVNALPVFDNTGTLSGSGSVSLHFNNAGTVNLAAGGSLGFSAIGTHSGSFSAGSGSAMGFGGLFAGPGHRFLGAVNSQGDVTLSRGRHQSSGAWNVARTFVQGGGEITFDGPAPQIGELHVNGDGLGRGALFNSAGGVSLQSVFVANTGVVAFNAGDSTVQALTLQEGVVAVHGNLLVAQTLDWHSGTLGGTGVLRLPGLVTLHDGTRAFTQGGRADLDGTLDWQAGNFSGWTGHMTVLPSGRVNIGGDFSSAGGGGSLLNRGAITKQAGSGRADLGMAVHSDGGLVRTMAGTLALSGGGVHQGATFNAAPGARIELSGGTVFGRSVTVSGRLDVVGGSFELLQGVQYAHAAGNLFEVTDLTIGTGAHLSVAERLRARGVVFNRGTLAPAASVAIDGDLNQYGNFSIQPGSYLQVTGQFTNAQPLTLTNSELFVGTLYNTSQFTVVDGGQYHYLQHLSNDGSVTLSASAGFAGLSTETLYNPGTLRLDGAATEFRHGEARNNGQIFNEGRWEANGLLAHGPAARMNNSGTLNLYGGMTLSAGSQVMNSGSVQLWRDSVFIESGAQLQGSGSYTQWDGTTVVNGLLGAGQGINIEGGLLKGTGTAQGPVYVGPNAAWKLGNSPGTFTVAGDAVLAGRLEVEVQSLAVHDRLVVSGNFTAFGGSAIDLVFDASFQPTDGDTIHWLQTGGTNLGGSVNTSGLPAYWSAALNPTSHAVEVTYDLANAIPLSGDHSIAAGEVGFNAVPGWNNQPNLNLLQNDGTFSNRSGATAAVTTLNNASGATVLNRGELYTGTLNNAGSLQNRPGSTLTGQTLNNSGNLFNEGTLQTYGGFNNAAGAVFEQRGEMQVGGRVTNDGSLVVAGRLVGPSVYNGNGDVLIEAGGSFEGSAGGWFWASAGHVRVDGLLAADDIRFFGNNNGRLSGTGRLQGNVQSYADIEPGNSVGTLTVDGNLRAYGDVNFEIASATEFDRLLVNGNAEINHATFFLLGDYRPTLGDSFGVLSVSGALSGRQGWHFLRLLDPQDPDSGWTLWADANGIYDPAVPADWRAVFASGTMSITAVPEPESWALWACGVFATASIVRRRKQSARAPAPRREA